MPKITRITVLVIGLIVTVSLAAFATSDPESSGSAATVAGKESWTADTSPITLSLYFNSPNIADFRKPWGKDPVSKKMIADTGVDLDMTIAPDDTSAKLNTMIAAGDLPDMLYMWMGTNATILREMANRDVIWKLGELSEKNAPNYMDNIDDHMLLAYRIFFDSMDLYWHPAFFTREKYWNSKWITKNMGGVVVFDQIYQELGAPEIKNTNDFIAHLKKVKASYPEFIPVQSFRGTSPDGDGNPQLIGRSLAFGGLAKRYFKGPSGWYKYYEHPDFIKVLKFANTLHEERLIDPTEFTDKREQLLGKLWGGKVYCDMQQDADNVPWFSTEATKATGKDLRLRMLPHFTIEPGMKWEGDYIRGGVGSSGIVVPKSGKNSVRVIRWLDYMLQDETQKVLLFGVEGHGHTLNDAGEPVRTPGWDALERDVRDLKYGISTYWIFREEYWGAYANKSTAEEYFAQWFTLADKAYADLTFISGAEVMPPNSEEQKIWANVKDYYSTEIMKIVSGSPGKVESDYKALLAKMKEMGLGKLNDHWTKFFEDKKIKINKYSVGLNPIVGK